MHFICNFLFGIFMRCSADVYAIRIKCFINNMCDNCYSFNNNNYHNCEINALETIGIKYLKCVAIAQYWIKCSESL